jgi:hypothetical protein
VQSGGLFENSDRHEQPGRRWSLGLAAGTGHPDPLLEPARPAARPSPTSGARAVGIYRQEFSGKILALNNRHGDLWDGAKARQPDRRQLSPRATAMWVGIVLVDVEAHTADYSGMAGRCLATNNPYRSCNGRRLQWLQRWQRRRMASAAPDRSVRRRRTSSGLAELGTIRNKDHRFPAEPVAPIHRGVGLSTTSRPTRESAAPSRSRSSI